MKLLRTILRVAYIVPFRHCEICYIVCRYLNQLCLLYLRVKQMMNQPYLSIFPLSGHAGDVCP